MRIALIDPFFDYSHRLWAEGFKRHSSHHITIYSGSPIHWKWKMAGGAMPLAEAVNNSGVSYDLFIVTDMLHLSVFKSLLDTKNINTPTLLYFHENQITYPWSATDIDPKLRQDRHYGLMHYTSCLVSDAIAFNSHYHLQSFTGALPKFLKDFPDSFENGINEVNAKSLVLPLGLELPQYKNSNANKPIFLWNHRWEYDKNPEAFFNVLKDLQNLKVDFGLIVMGKQYKQSPEVFNAATTIFSNEMIHFGYVEDRKKYEDLLAVANVLLVTNNQDFFGISVVEGIAAGCYPCLPNRLSYPEHIPSSFGDPVFYDKDEEIVPLIMSLIESGSYRESQMYSNYVRKYDWSTLIDSYDELCESVKR